MMTTTPDCEIVSIRLVPAPRALVYAAWTDPNHLKNWWGPAGFTNTFHEFDLRPCGRWRFTMHGPDKGHYPNECEFIQIEEPALLAWRRLTKPLFHVVVTLEEVSANQTNIVFKMLFDSAEDCRKVKAFAPEKNEENFDRLEKELALMAATTHKAT